MPAASPAVPPVPRYSSPGQPAIEDALRLQDAQERADIANRLNWTTYCKRTYPPKTARVKSVWSTAGTTE